MKTPPELVERLELLRLNIETVYYSYGLMLDEKLDPGEYCVLVIDPNRNAMGLQLVEEVEADTSFVARVKAGAQDGTAKLYFNIAKNEQLGPLLCDLKIAFDGSIRNEERLTQPLHPEWLRVLVSIKNSAWILDTQRPIQVSGPGIADA